jgi:hypothetical protein
LARVSQEVFVVSVHSSDVSEDDGDDEIHNCQQCRVSITVTMCLGALDLLPQRYLLGERRFGPTNPFITLRTP